ncbi:CPBP family intramembrane glutamic endopeptidase [Ichthyobacterium seriolicida]|uniref:CAAX amino terminal protease family n=1 Tax=Ichthyobacterium seriolicida TaxID=242600 RepID=A0A1J1ECT2_9FLAO|nr:CPBP family intramembrane glutamic endopeptidase [Ichthyobacterium seriolicida]BAV95312.1 CAAX amino terminal protease family [Ichthyobacterium seriolicida]
MKEMYRAILKFVALDFNIKSYLYFLIFMSVTIYLNYRFDFDNSVIMVQPQHIRIVYYFALYSFAYYGILIPKMYLTGKEHKLKRSYFWIKSIFFLVIMSIALGSTFVSFFPRLENHVQNHFIRSLAINIEEFIFYAICFGLFSIIFYKKRWEAYYGLNIKNVNILPYVWMLAIMFPIILLGSIQEDFLNYYPTFRVNTDDGSLGISKTVAFSLYEMCYSISFISTEFMFRGVLVIGLSRALGRDAILPMTATYAFIHFGKPELETISSIFGGYILGILALKSKNILGGCLVHIGIALMMDTFTFIQKW